MSLFPEEIAGLLGSKTSFFIGIVEATDDPLTCGRVRVRAFGWHTEDRSEATGIPTKDLPWAIVLQPSTSAASSGVGWSSGLINSSMVFGIFLDGETGQYPLVLGSLFHIHRPAGPNNPGGNPSTPVQNTQGGSTAPAMPYHGQGQEPNTKYPASAPLPNQPGKGASTGDNGGVLGQNVADGSWPLKYYSKQEMKNMHMPTAMALDSAAASLGRKIPITGAWASGGHVSHSQHYLGRAVDLPTGTSKEIIQALVKAGFVGFGNYGHGNNPGSGSYHADTRASGGVSWGYDYHSKTTPAFLLQWLHEAGWYPGRPPFQGVKSNPGQPQQAPAANNSTSSSDDTNTNTQTNNNSSLPTRIANDPDANASAQNVASQHGFSTQALGGVIGEESLGDTTAGTGSFNGLTQIGNQTFAENGGTLGGMTYEQYLNATPAQQIDVYGAYLDHYNFSGQLQQNGIDLSSYPPDLQYAYLQGFQFSPNGTAWKQAFAAGNYNVPVTNSPQAANLGSTSIADMAKAYNAGLPGFGGAGGTGGGGSVAGGSGGQTPAGAGGTMPGYHDPTNSYPTTAYQGQPSMNMNARGVNGVMNSPFGATSTIPVDSDNSQAGGFPIAGDKGTFAAEPPQASSPKYGMNHVYNSRSGHMLSLDDSPGAEVIALKHGPSGSKIQMNPGGTISIRAKGDLYTLVVHNEYHGVQGDAYYTSQGDTNIRATSDLNIHADGGLHIQTFNDRSDVVAGRFDMMAGSRIELKSCEKIIIEAPDIEVYSTGGINFHSQKDMCFTSAEGGFKFNAKTGFEITAKKDVVTKTDADIKMQSKNLSGKIDTDIKFQGTNINLNASSTGQFSASTMGLKGDTTKLTGTNNLGLFGGQTVEIGGGQMVEVNSLANLCIPPWVDGGSPPSQASNAETAPEAKPAKVTDAQSTDLGQKAPDRRTIKKQQAPQLNPNTTITDQALEAYSKNGTQNDLNNIIQQNGGQTQNLQPDSNLLNNLGKDNAVTQPTGLDPNSPTGQDLQNITSTNQVGSGNGSSNSGITGNDADSNLLNNMGSNSAIEADGQNSPDGPPQSNDPNYTPPDWSNGGIPTTTDTGGSLLSSKAGYDDNMVSASQNYLGQREGSGSVDAPPTGSHYGQFQMNQDAVNAAAKTMGVQPVNASQLSGNAALQQQYLDGYQTTIYNYLSRNAPAFNTMTDAQQLAAINASWLVGPGAGAQWINSGFNNGVISPDANGTTAASYYNGTLNALKKAGF